ncbi:hypothetical protein ACVWYF_002515 [Hymenobacter sp. UYAg731]
MSPESAPQPPKDPGSVRPPLLLNAALMLVLYLVAFAAGDGKPSETAYAYFFALAGLFGLNVLAAIILAFMGRRQTVMGCIYSGIGIFLIGLGSCAYSLAHMGGGH